MDPLHGIRGWSDTASSVGEASRTCLKKQTCIIICPDYSTASQVSFYLPGSPSGGDKKATNRLLLGSR